MTPQIQEILNDLYLIDSNFKKMEKELIEIIKKLLETKPDVEFTKEFKDSLTREILNIIDKKMENKFSYKDFFSNFFLSKKYVFSFALLILLIGTSLIYLNFESTKKIRVANVQINQALETGLSLADILKTQIVFANANLAYNPIQISPDMKESENNPLKANNIDYMQKALNIKFTDDQIKFLEENKFLLLDIFKNKNNFCFFQLNNSEGCMGNPVGGYLSYDQMVSLFSSFAGSSVDYGRAPSNALYVNSDIILHSYHLFFDRYLKRLEEKNLYPLLNNIIFALQQKAFIEIKNSKDPQEKDSLNRIAAYLTIGKVLLDTSASKPEAFNSIEDEENWKSNDKFIDQNSEAFLKNLEKYKDNFDSQIYEKMKSEIVLISDSKSTNSSPLFGAYNPKGITDYTQFTPRSHYNETSVLRAYFRAMMLFGRQTFYFGSETGFKDAVTLTYLLSDPQIEHNWEKLFDVTNFIAGASDDITYNQLAKITIHDVINDCQESCSGGLQIKDVSLTDLLNNENFEKIKDQAKKLPNPKIFSEIVFDENMGDMTKDDLLLASKGLRLFGQKFTFDAYVLNQTSAGVESTEIGLPSTPSSVFVAGVIGSDLVKNILPQWVENQNNSNLNSDSIWNKILSLRVEFNKLSPQEWLSNISSAWLWSFSPLLQNYGAGYPAFMQNELYQTKNLQSVLGSYTELKHDTLLYAKQSYAELGAGGGPETEKPEIVKGFVEPDIEFWNRMIALTRFTEEGLQSRDLLDSDAQGRLDIFLEELNFYQGLASKELQNQEITDDEYEQLRTNFWKVSQIIAPFDNAILEEDDKKSPLVVDIHTDALKDQILYEATGYPLIMLSFVSDQGTPRLVIGVTFRHFEFTEALSGQKRLTDQEWKKRVEEDKIPETPFYYKELFVK